MTRSVIVQAHGLVKEFAGQRVVDGVDLEVRQGECFGLLGPNGAGKTTTLRMLLGLCLPAAGVLEVLSYPIPERSREMRARVGLVPQQDNLDPDFTVIENLNSYASYFGLQGPQLVSLIKELLVFAALEHKAEAKISELSGGMQRRLTLIRALVNRPDLVILDEPTTGLDPQARHVIWQRLRQLTHQGATLILTTHYMEEAQRLCDRLAIMDNGCILAEGSPTELIRTHIEPYVLEIHDAGLSPRLRERTIELAERVEPVGETLFCYLREEAALLAELRQHNGLQYLYRPANLEDVFLKLTGREMRDT